MTRSNSPAESLRRSSSVARTSSFARAFRTCVRTVSNDRPRSSAICSSLAPSRRARSITRSVAVRALDGSPGDVRLRRDMLRPVSPPGLADAEGATGAGSHTRPGPSRLHSVLEAASHPDSGSGAGRKQPSPAPRPDTLGCRAGCAESRNNRVHSFSRRGASSRSVHASAILHAP